MSDFSEPTVSTTYTAFPGKVRDLAASCATMEFASDTNIPDNTLRYNRTTKQLEEYDSGSSTWTAQEIGNLKSSSVGTSQLASAVSEKLAQTGDIAFGIFTTAASGWVLMQGGTIGSASSGATVRANSDTESLFVHLWNNLANAQAAVSGGRGASGAADFAANKTITLPDMRQRFPLILSGSGTGNTLGATGGTIDHTHTTPNHTHTIASHTHTLAHTHTVSDHTHSAGSLRARVGYRLDAAADGIQFSLDGGTTFTADYRWTASGVSVASGYSSVPTTLVTGSTDSGGAQTTSAASVADTGGSGTLTSNSGEGGSTTGTANPAFLTINCRIKL